MARRRPSSFPPDTDADAELAGAATAVADPPAVDAAEPPTSPVTTVAWLTLRLDQLVPSPANPSTRMDIEDPALRELGESLKRLSQQQPIVVREITTAVGRDTTRPGHNDPIFEILAGHRRYAAAKLVGLPTLEARVVDCDDRGAQAVRVVENLQRVDLHWTDAAQGVAALCASGWSIETIAHQLGKSPRWVALRARLASLHPEWLRLARGGKPKAAPAWRRVEVDQWPVAMLELIGRHDLGVQAAMAEDGDLVDHRDVKALESYIDSHYLMALKAAPWDLDDAFIVADAGACSACPKRSSAQQQLFDQPAKGGDRCTDAPCWQRKKEAFLALREAELRAEHPKLLTIGEASDAREDKSVVPSYYTEKVKAGTKGATAVMEKESGKLVYVKPVKHAPKDVLAKFGPGAVAGDDKDGQPSAPKTTPAERLEQHLKRRWRHVAAAVVTALGGEPDAGWSYANKHRPLKPGTTKVPPRKHLVALAAAVGTQDDAEMVVPGRPTLAKLGIADRFDHWGNHWRNFAALAEAKDAELDVYLWQRIRGQLVDMLGVVDSAEPEPGIIAQICFAAEIDLAKLKAAALDALPLPKTLAQIYAEDGTKLGAAKAARPAKAKAKSAKGGGR